MKRLIANLIYSLLLGVVISTTLCAQSPLPEALVTNGGVSHITRGDGKVFLSGRFNWVGSSYGTGAAIFNQTLTHDDSYPVIGKELRAAVADDAGGWYIAGDGYIKHLKADKTVDEFAVDVSGYIQTLAKAGNILYIGGSFSVINGVTRGNLAAIDLTTGTLTAWNPNANSYVQDIKVSGSIVYAGGHFTTIGGQTRRKIAALDASTGLATAWNANVTININGSVYSIVVDATTVYFGGAFANVGGGSPARTNVGAVNTTTGALVAFNPRPNGIVYKLLLDGTTLYMAGSFTQVAATAKQEFAAMNVTTGTFAFDVDVNSSVYALAIDGQKLFIGGEFTTVNNEDRPRLAVVNKTTGVLESMSAEKISDAAGGLIVSGGNILALAGNYFMGITGESRSNGCAALDENTGLLTDWMPELPAPPEDGYVTDVDLHYQDNRVYYLWRFSYDGYHLTELGVVNSTDGAAISTWSVTANDVIDAWAFSDDALYLAGQFTEVNGESRAGFAAVDLATGDVLPWVTTFVPGDEEITSMAVHNNVLYAAGEFYFTDNGQERQNLASWDATTGALTAWSPEYFSDFGRPKIGAVTDTRVYIIGNGIYSLDATSPESGPDWLAFFNEGQVHDIAIHGSTIYVGGYFTTSQVAGIRRIDITTGETTGTQPELIDIYASEGSYVNAIAVTETKLFAGGDFSLDVAGIQRANFLVYEIPEATAAVITDDLITTCSDLNASISVDASGTDILYQWQKWNEETEEFEDVTDSDQYEGTTTSTLSIITAEDFASGEYRCLVSTSEGSQYSNIATVEVTPPCNQPPSIETLNLQTQVGGSVAVDLIPLITTETDNLDPNSIQVTEPPSSGASATVVDGVLTIDYSGIAFSGTEQITVQVCNIYGNCTTQQFSIEVAGDIVAYNGISPGGANPMLVFRNIELLPETKDNQVTIYDRWQNEVWRGTNYNNSTVVFNGASDKGKDLPTGTYFYKIEFSSKRKTQTGFISLKR